MILEALLKKIGLLVVIFGFILLASGLFIFTAPEKVTEPSCRAEKVQCPDCPICECDLVCPGEQNGCTYDYKNGLLIGAICR